MEFDLSILNYEKDMGEYIIEQDTAEELRGIPLQKQMEIFKMQVRERDDDDDETTYLSLDSHLFRGSRTSYRFAQLALKNQGIIVDNGLIVGVKTDKGYLLLGQRHSDMLIPMFTDEYGGGQGDINCYRNETRIVIKK